MDQNPLVIQEIEAGADLVRKFQRYLPVEAAFWLNPAEEGRWSLYIASEKIDDTNFDIAYGEIFRIADLSKTPFLDPFQVNLIGSSDPLAKAAVDLGRKYPGLMPNRIRGANFGGMSIEEVYIYSTQNIDPRS